jgi:enoyl-CoA hydratase
MTPNRRYRKGLASFIVDQGRAMPVRIEQKEHVTTVIIDRIDARNAVDEPTAEALMQAFVGFEADPDARAAVLWGAGGTFCAG